MAERARCEAAANETAQAAAEALAASDRAEETFQHAQAVRDDEVANAAAKARAARGAESSLACSFVAENQAFDERGDSVAKCEQLHAAYGYAGAGFAGAVYRRAIHPEKHAQEAVREAGSASRMEDIHNALDRLESTRSSR